jgi:outer membrane receptor protein involved in Fe transport
MAVLASSIPIYGLAQTVSKPTRTTPNTTVQTLIVTAERRSENIEKVPLSITAISGDDLQQQGAHEFNEVLTQVPNLSFEYGLTGASGEGLSSSRGIVIRGISSNGTTALYLNDVEVPLSFDPRLLDIDRVEVLKGPQGTLYGAASMGGTIKILLRDPSTTEFKGNIVADLHDVHLGGLGTFDSAGLNIPIRPDVAGLYVGGFYDYEPGFLRRTYNDPAAINGAEASGPLTTVHHVGTVRSYGALAQLRLSPLSIPGLTIAPMVLYQYSRSDGLGLADFSASNLVQRRVLNIPEAWSDKFFMSALTLTYQSPIGKFTSVSAYRRNLPYDQEDGSDVLQELIGLPYLVPSTGFVTFLSDAETQEFRLESDIGRSFQTVVGGYFSTALVTYRETIPSPGANAASGGALGTDQGFLAYNPNRAVESSGFVDGAYALTSRIKLNAGVRVSEFWLHQEYTASGFYNGGSSVTSSKSYSSAISPRFSAQYQVTDDHMIYFTASKGFRPGGSQFTPAICAADLAAVGLQVGNSEWKPDSLWNYEIGAKTQWLAGRLLVNVAAYDMEWSNIIETVRLPDCGFPVNVNGAKARSQGSELELTAAPGGGFTIGFAAGYEDARITGVLPNSATLYVGQPLNGVPKWTVSGHVAYEHPTPGLGDLYGRVDVEYVGDSLSLSNSPVSGRVRPAYTLVNLRAGTRIDQWDVSLFAKNVFDVRPNLGDEISEVIETPGRPRYVVGAPRTLGVEVRKDF